MITNVRFAIIKVSNYTLKKMLVRGLFIDVAKPCCSCFVQTFLACFIPIFILYAEDICTQALKEMLSIFSASTPLFIVVTVRMFIYGVKI